MERPTDATSQSPRTAGRPSGSEQPQASGDPTLPNPRPRPETGHSGPSSGSSPSNNHGSGSQFSSPWGGQFNNTAGGNQFPWAKISGPVNFGNINHPTRREKEKEILKCLDASPYRDGKDRNPDRVSETCDWFVSHELFRDWQESKSGMLWVSADPGCGKSVLAKYLVDFVLPNTESRPVCYFFFKDDFEDQRNVVSGLCCILHQLFTRKRILLSDAILDQFDTNREKFTSSFCELWQTLINAAEDENAGEIICLLDAIDECENQGWSQLQQALCKLYGTRTNSNLKFLLTSRPYGRIGQGFRSLEIPRLPVIHLSGESEKEMKKISQEIDIFIKARVQDIKKRLKLTHDERDLLLRGLMGVSNRTYLWVHLTLNLIEKDINIDINKTRIAKATTNLPKTVDEAYDKILSKSRDSEEAKKILHIIVVAARPLTLKEISLALVIGENDRSYSGLDLIPEGRFREKVRDNCGLFVTIIDSKIYLLHQTAKEFLVQNDTVSSPEGVHRDLKWKHSLRPRESHCILTKICIWYLLLTEFETHPLDGNGPLSQYVEDYIFLDYAAKHWTAHLRELQVEIQDAMTESTLRVCDISSRRCLTWFRIYWTSTNTDFPRGFTTLMIASYFGLRTAVKRLLKMDDIDLNTWDDTYQRSALSWAAGNGFDAVVKLLIKGAAIGLKNLKLPIRKGAKVNSVDKYGRTPLTYAVWSGNVAVVKLLINAGAGVDSEDEIGGTPLSYAVCNGHKEVVKLLLKKGTQVDSEDDISKKLLFSATEKGDEAVVKLLLEAGRVDIEAKDRFGRTPLLYAAERGHTAVVEVLLEKANINARDRVGATALHWVARNGHGAVISLLLKNAADIEARDKGRGTPLAWAIEGGFETGIRMLLAKTSEVDYWYTPLRQYYEEYERQYYYEYEERRELEYYLEREEKTPLMRAVERGNETAISLLLEKGAALNSVDAYGRSPLSLAKAEGNETVIKLLESYRKS